MATSKKNKTWIWLAVLAAGGVAYYLYNKSKQSAALPAPSPGTLPAATTVSVQQPAMETPQQAAPPPSINLPSIAPASQQPVPIPVTTAGPSEIEEVKQWATSLDAANLAQFNISFPSFTQGEWDGLYDLIVNDWAGGQGNTAAREMFWNDWRVKYHILDGTYE